jgi:hypothetical protein
MGIHDTSPSKPAHTPGTRKGEEITRKDGKEAGRQEKETSHANRPGGERQSRDSTGINPEDMGSKTGKDMPPA